MEGIPSDTKLVRTKSLEVTRLVHEGNPVVIDKQWSELSEAEKRSVLMDHFMVHTRTTRGLEENDYQTLLRIDRAIKNTLSMSDPEDRNFLSRYGDIASSLPKSQGGVWILIRSIEDKLKEPVVANLWQDAVIYGFIDGSQAVTLLKQAETLLFRFSLRNLCLCTTLRQSSKGKTRYKHELLPDGYTQSYEMKWKAYSVVMANRKIKKVAGLLASYAAKEITQQRDQLYTSWHEANYGSPEMFKT